MRIGIFGGSFDPVHLGHLRLADCCLQQARLERVEFVAACRQPHKPEGPVALDDHRVAMLRLAVEGRPQFRVSTVEINRGGLSYTVDTLRELKTQQPGSELFFLMGADSLADFPNWRDPQGICELATPLVVRRAGMAEPDFDVLRPFVEARRVAEIREMQVEMPETPISSSQIRELVAHGVEWQSFVPPAVAAYILSHGLYRP